MFNLSKLASLKQAGTQGSFDNLSPDKAFHFRDPIHVNTDVDPCNYSARCRIKHLIKTREHPVKPFQTSSPTPL